MEAEVKEILLPKNKLISPSHSSLNETNFKLKRYSSGLKWFFLYYSSSWKAGLSWSIFFLLNIGIPVVSHFDFSCSDCDRSHQRPYDAVVQLPLSLFTALSFISLSTFARKYGLRRFLFLDKLCDESEKVRNGYTQQLQLCSITLVTGLVICLRSAAKITHKAQAITSLAAKWHACATINSFDELNDETPTAEIASVWTSYPATSDLDTDDEEVEDDALDNTNLVPVFANTVSYQRRQALVTYFQHNKAGITVYGFTLDRSWIHMILAVQLTLTLWILNKTIGIS